MLYKFARVLQLIGLVLLPVAISGNAADKMSLKNMLILAAAGMLIFFLGWLLQQSTRPQ